jgi:hypothetical protein
MSPYPNHPWLTDYATRLDRLLWLIGIARCKTCRRRVRYYVAWDSSYLGIPVPIGPFCPECARIWFGSDEA